MKKSVFIIIIVAILVTACKKHNTDKTPEEIRLEEAVENFANVATSIDSFYLESDTVDDMAARIDDIKAVEGVVDAYVSNSCLYVKIEGWGTVGYPFDYDDGDGYGFDDVNMTVLHQEFTRVATRAGDDGNRPDSGNYSVYILNSQHLERQWTREIVRITQEMFETCGFNVKYEPFPLATTFRDDMFDYDIIFIIGHGLYDSKTDSHWVETTETFRVYDENTMADVDDLVNETDELRLYRERKTRDSQDGITFQTYISEKYIENAPKRFAQDGKAVIFMVPCQTLLGSVNMREDNGRMINDNLAQAFFDRGAGLYIGYDESSSALAQFGGMNFLANLLSGCSFQEAIERMPNTDEDVALYANRHLGTDPDPDATYIFEHCVHRDNGVFIREWDVARHVLQSPNGFQMDAFIVSPKMTPSEPTEDRYAFSACAYYSPDVSLKFEDYGVTYNGDPTIPYSFLNESRPTYGFAIGKGTDPAAGTRHPASVTRDPSQHLVEYQISLSAADLEADTEYRIWPYIAVGDSYNYGDPYVFTTQPAPPEDTPVGGDIEGTEYDPWN